MHLRSELQEEILAGQTLVRDDAHLTQLKTAENLISINVINEILAISEEQL